ncbi:MAG: LOG family protein [Pirellulales bacterium]|nr:LOG family protein [Pirellulales bacterium]
MDEGLEVLTLLQTGKRDMCPVIFMDVPGGTFWKPFDDMIRNALLANGMISPEDTSLYKLMDNVDDAIEEVLGFFRVYHSMRYVRGRLVLRLYHDISDDLLADINMHFSDILKEGTYERTEPLPDERDEPELAGMPRIVFHFDRHGLGRLRQLIDTINRGSVSETQAS